MVIAEGWSPDSEGCAVHWVGGAADEGPGNTHPGTVLVWRVARLFSIGVHLTCEITKTLRETYTSGCFSVSVHLETRLYHVPSCTPKAKDTKPLSSDTRWLRWQLGNSWFAENGCHILYTGFHYMALRYVRLLFHSARPSSAAGWETFSLLLTAKRIDSASIILPVSHKRCSK